MKERLVCLILAAGASSRMGGHPKALLPWGATTVIQHLFSQVKQSGIAPIVLVTGAHHKQLNPIAVSEAVTVCQNSEWEKGIGSSLSRGIGFLETQFPEVEAVLVLLADQPLLTADYLAQIQSEHVSFPQQMVVSGYGESEGVPALFPRKYWPSLLELPPTKGASRLIKSQKPNIRVLYPGEALLDIDTPKAYKKALEIAKLTEN